MKQVLIPLKEVNIVAVIDGAYATLSVDTIYKNTSDCAMECVYDFPIGSDIMLSQLLVKQDE